MRGSPGCNSRTPSNGALAHEHTRKGEIVVRG